MLRFLPDAQVLERVAEAQLGQVAHARDHLRQRRAPAQVAQQHAQHDLLAQLPQRALQLRFVAGRLRREECAHGAGVEGLLDGGERGLEQPRPRLRQALRVTRTSRRA